MYLYAQILRTHNKKLAIVVVDLVIEVLCNKLHL